MPLKEELSILGGVSASVLRVDFDENVGLVSAHLQLLALKKAQNGGISLQRF